MLYECNNCGLLFESDQAEFESFDMENEYGVGGSFPDHHSGLKMICPDCGSDEIGEAEEIDSLTGEDLILVREAVKTSIRVLEELLKSGENLSTSRIHQANYSIKAYRELLKRL